MWQTWGPDLTEFRQVDDQYKRKLKKQFDRRHRVRELPVLEGNTPVYISSGRNTATTQGSIIQTAGRHSYEVQTPSKISQRNRSFLQERPVELDEHWPVQEERSNQEEETEQPRSPVLTQSKTGTVIKPPDKLNLWGICNVTIDYVWLCNVTIYMYARVYHDYSNKCLIVHWAAERTTLMWSTSVEIVKDKCL